MSANINATTALSLGVAAAAATAGRECQDVAAAHVAALEAVCLLLPVEVEVVAVNVGVK